MKPPFDRSFYDGPTTNYPVGAVICHGYFVGTITRVGETYYEVTLLDEVEHFTRHILIHRREAIRPEEAEVRRAWLDARDKRVRLERAEMLLRGAQEHRQAAWLASSEADDALRAAQEALAEEPCPLGTSGCNRSDCSPARGHSCYGPNAPRHIDMGD